MQSLGFKLWGTQLFVPSVWWSFDEVVHVRHSARDTEALVVARLMRSSSRSGELDFGLRVWGIEGSMRLVFTGGTHK